MKFREDVRLGLKILACIMVYLSILVGVSYYIAGKYYDLDYPVPVKKGHKWE